MNLYLADVATKCGYGDCPPSSLPITGAEPITFAAIGLLVVAAGCALRALVRR